MLTNVSMMCLAESDTGLVICWEHTASQLKVPSVIFVINKFLLPQLFSIYLPFTCSKAARWESQDATCNTEPEKRHFFLFYDHCETKLAIFPSCVILAQSEKERITLFWWCRYYVR